MRRLIAAAGTAVLLISARAFSQKDYSGIDFETVHVAGTVYVIAGSPLPGFEPRSGGNIGVSIGEDGALMIDDQMLAVADKIRTKMSEIGDGKLGLLLNTHHHFDHTGGNAAFGDEATIIAHENVRKRLIDREKPKVALPVITYDHSLELNFNGETIQVVHFPNSHTDGDSVIYFRESNVIHMGDLFFKDWFPTMDLENGGSVEGYIAAVEEAIEMIPPDAKIIPGHGALATRQDLIAFHSMLRETTEQIRSQVKAGNTLEEIKSAGLPSKRKKWGSGYVSEQLWIQKVYDSLTN